MTRTTRRSAVSRRHPAESHLGAISGTVLRAARLSANVTKNALATAVGVSRTTIRSWESGSAPLASVPASDLRRLEDALASNGAEQQIVADLSHAMWCDLIFAAVNENEDVNCLLADPITAEDAFRQLLAWAMTGQVPARYRRYFTSAPIVTNEILVDRAFHTISTVYPALTQDWTAHPAADEAGQRAFPPHVQERIHDRRRIERRPPCRQINRQHHCTPPWRRSIR
jgi:transcriptional regulator with XRE-family HTH domain